MANWKKVIVSGSNARLNIITASAANPLNLSGIGHNSTDTTPLVIDVYGNVQTGSKYAKESGGNTVGAISGSTFTASIAIVAAGHGSNLIQTASGTVPVDFNTASLFGATDITASGIISGATQITASGYHINSTNLAQFNGSNLIIGGATNTIISASQLLISASGGITASVVPETVRPPFYLGQLDGGEVVKIALANVDGGGSGTGLVGVNSGDNINISSGITSTEELLVATKTTTSANGITGSKGNFNFDLVEVGDTIKIRFEDATEIDNLTISEIVLEDANDQDNLGALVFNETITLAYQDQSIVSAYIAQSTTTGIPTINLNDELSITGSITASGDLIFSSSTAAPHQIYPAGWGTADEQILNITASNITASTVEAGTFFLDGFTFANSDIINTSASTAFGNAITDIHRFTGSIFISASNLTLGQDSEQGIITAPSFSGDGSSLTNLDSGELDLGGLKAGSGISVGIDFTDDGGTLIGSGSRIYNPTGSQLDIKINVDNDTIEINDDKLRVKADSIGATQLTHISALAEGGVSGSATQIPVITVNPQGQVTSLTTAVISSTLDIAADSGTDDGVAIGTDTLTFTGGTGITTSVSGDTITISADRTDGATFTGTTTIENLDLNGNLVGDGIGSVDIDASTTINIDAATSINIGGGSNGVGITIGHTTSETTIGDNLSVDGTLGVTGNTTLTNVSMSGDLNLAGNLHVHGTTTTFNTTNLDIEDRFILLGSGSANSTANLDTGIIFEAGDQDGIGTALYHDAGLSRVSIAKSVNNATVNNVNAESSGIAGHVVTVKYGVSTPSNVVDEVTAAEFGAGEMIIDTSKDIWIYTS